MLPDYKNWVPFGMVVSLAAGTLLCFALLLIFGVIGLWVSGAVRIGLFVVFLLGFGFCAVFLFLYIRLRRAFSYTGKRQLSRQIIEGVASHVKLPPGGVGLDVGCGSGALTIACAKRNKQAMMVGIDRWGKDYSSFSKLLCERNAVAEHADNARFLKGDATKLEFPDDSFDAVTSNYVYHNIALANRQELLLETLRLLKKGGCFAIHDIMSFRRYGDMEAFRRRLLDMGYAKAELIDTANGMFMSRREAKLLFLDGSMLLIGTK